MFPHFFVPSSAILFLCLTVKPGTQKIRPNPSRYFGGHFDFQHENLIFRTTFFNLFYKMAFSFGTSKPATNTFGTPASSTSAFSGFGTPASTASTGLFGATAPTTSSGFSFGGSGVGSAFGAKTTTPSTFGKG